MAATADASNHHSPRGPGFAGDAPNHLRRTNLSSPWAQVVRGDPESSTPVDDRSPSSPVAASSADHNSFSDCSPPPNNSVAELCDGGDKSNAGESKPVWNKPSNGVIEAGAVMGAVSWPALSESTRASPKSLADGSVSTSQAPIIPPVIPLSPKKQAASTNSISTPNHTLPRQRSMKRGGGGGHIAGGPSQSGFTRPPPPPPPPRFPVFHVPPNSYGTLIPGMPESSPREPPYRGSTWATRPNGGFVPQSNMVNDHRNSSRRGNYGPRGDVSYHNNIGGRRDHDHAKYGNHRDVRMPPQRGPPRGIVRAPPPPPNNAPFINTQTVTPFPSPFGFTDATSQLYYYPRLPLDSFRSVPFIAPAPPTPLFIPISESPLHSQLLDQIDYYFSDANLITDDFLKSKMDEQGWVPITLIAGFPRVKSLTNNVQIILDSLRASTVVEVQDDKLRRRNDWIKWIPKLGRPSTTEPGSPSSGSGNYRTLATSFQKVALEEVKSERNGIVDMRDNHLEAVAGRTSSPGSALQPQLCNGGDMS